MLKGVDLRKILFLDIETAPQKASFEELSDKFKSLWEKKSSYFRKEGDTPASVYNRAGIYAEFGKIICISFGIINSNKSGSSLRIKSFFDDDEVKLLKQFCTLLNTSFSQPDYFLCAHNGKEFDFPYIARRCLINGLQIPEILNTSGARPWEIRHYDTMELWKFGDYKNFTSLDLLTAVFGLPSPKNDIDGSDVWRVYWQDHDLERIARYCESDVYALSQVFLKYLGISIIPENQVFSVTFS